MVNIAFGSFIVTGKTNIRVQISSRMKDPMFNIPFFQSVHLEKLYPRIKGNLKIDVF